MPRFRVVALSLALAALAQSQPLRSLKTVPTPAPPNLSTYVRDPAALLVLGKALFWDMQAGSDGRTACATCHFHAGADHRPQNQISNPNTPFPTNRVLAQIEFPLRQLTNPDDRNSPALRDSSHRIGSAGVHRRVYYDITPGRADEQGGDALDQPAFSQSNLQVRRVTSRNAPSVINAVFHVRNFWDGRAERIFTHRILISRNGILSPEQVQLNDSSLASQAVGPIMDHLEMSYEGRTWPSLARKLFNLTPLALQRVAPDDSILGPYSNGRGLNTTYLNLIQSAFQSNLWEGEPAQAETNFSFFWALAIQAYESTLVSNESAFDRFQEGDPNALSPQQQEGLALFQNAARCTQCHAGPEFSNAAITAIGNGNGLNGRAFQRTGVRPIQEDPGQSNGAFKSIGLRNIEFTGPYFHNGGQATLEQVIDFYVRAGDFNPNNNNIRTFNATPVQRASLVAFLKSLSDDRVRYERAPFDHPELCVPSGHTESSPGVLRPSANPYYPTSAEDQWLSIPAVGAAGNLVPLRTFEEMQKGAGADGSRAHAFTEKREIP